MDGHLELELRTSATTAPGTVSTTGAEKEEEEFSNAQIGHYTCGSGRCLSKILHHTHCLHDVACWCIRHQILHHTHCLHLLKAATQTVTDKLHRDGAATHTVTEDSGGTNMRDHADDTCIRKSHRPPRRSFADTPGFPAVSTRNPPITTSFGPRPTSFHGRPAHSPRTDRSSTGRPRRPLRACRFFRWGRMRPRQSAGEKNSWLKRGRYRRRPAILSESVREKILQSCQTQFGRPAVLSDSVRGTCSPVSVRLSSGDWCCYNNHRSRLKNSHLFHVHHEGVEDRVGPPFGPHRRLVKRTRLRRSSAGARRPLPTGHSRSHRARRTAGTDESGERGIGIMREGATISAGSAHRLLRRDRGRRAGGHRGVDGGVRHRGVDGVRHRGVEMGRRGFRILHFLNQVKDWFRDCWSWLFESRRSVRPVRNGTLLLSRKTTMEYIS